MPGFKRRIHLTGHKVKAFLDSKWRSPEAPRPAPTVVSESADGQVAGAISSENIVWIFGTGRSGSTWLCDMMGAPSGYWTWREPLIGELFGRFYNTRDFAHLSRTHFIMAESTRETWLEGIRFLVLSGAEARFPEATGSDYLVIQEINGSAGAPLLMKALPESRMIFLVRDPRDVVASAVDRNSKGGEAYELRRREYLQRGGDNPDEDDPNTMATRQARRYLGNMKRAKQAYEAHQGRKALVTYEELRSDTLGTMRRLYSTLKLAVDERELVRAVEKHSWENIPEEEKGLRKWRRKATPGGWREDLTPGQVEIVERITAPLLKEFYPA